LARTRQFISLGRVERDQNFARIRYNLTLSRALTFAGTKGDLTLPRVGRRDLTLARTGRELTQARTVKDLTLPRVGRRDLTLAMTGRNLSLDRTGGTLTWIGRGGS
jgi:hypothetical protein